MNIADEKVLTGLSVSGNSDFQGCSLSQNALTHVKDRCLSYAEICSSKTRV